MLNISLLVTCRPDTDPAVPGGGGDEVVLAVDGDAGHLVRVGGEGGELAPGPVLIPVKSTLHSELTGDINSQSLVLLEMDEITKLMPQ